MNLDTLVLGAFVVAIAIVQHWLPLWRRQQLWFGVTVPSGIRHTAEGRRVLGRYRASVWVMAFAAAAAVVAGTAFQSRWLTLTGVLCQSIGASATFAIVRRRLRPFSVDLSQIRSADLSQSHPEGLPGGAASVIGPLTIVAGTAVYLWTRWRELPTRFPIRWGLNGVPERWADRTWAHVYGPLLIGALVVIFQLGMGEAILRGSPRGRVSGTEGWTARFRRLNLLLLIAGTWGVAIISASFALAQVWSPGGLYWGVRVMPVLLVVLMVPFGWQMIRLTQDSKSSSDGTPDQAWKFGLFYYNPADSAVMVEKRFGLGYTFNFGNRLVWSLLGFAVLLFVLGRMLITSP